MEETEQENNINKVSPNGSKAMMVGVAVLVVVGLGFFFFQSRNKENVAMQNTISDQQAFDEQALGENDSSKEPQMEGVINLEVEGSNYLFNPDEIKVKVGDKVSITFTSNGAMHDFVLDEFDVKTKVLNSGESETISFTVDKAGEYEYYCSVGNHRAMGMKGTLIVE